MEKAWNMIRLNLSRTIICSHARPSTNCILSLIVCNSWPKKRTSNKIKIRRTSLIKEVKIRMMKRKKIRLQRRTQMKEKSEYHSRVLSKLTQKSEKSIPWFQKPFSMLWISNWKFRALLSDGTTSCEFRHICDITLPPKNNTCTFGWESWIHKICPLFRWTTSMYFWSFWPEVPLRIRAPWFQKSSPVGFWKCLIIRTASSEKTTRKQKCRMTKVKNLTMSHLSQAEVSQLQF